MSVLSRRRAVQALLAAGMLGLLVLAFRPDVPFAVSLRVARRFWNAGPRGRIQNAPGFVRTPELTADALRRGTAWPVGWDAVLSVGPEVSPPEAEELRRRVAYLLAPRRVTLRSGTPGALAIEPVRPAGEEKR